MKKLTHPEIKSKRAKPDEIHQLDRIPLVVVVDNVRSLYNVGSIFRTSDGAMIQKLVLTGYTPFPPRNEIEKTALGSTKSVPWEHVKSPLEAVRLLKGQGYTPACLELTDKSVPYTHVTPAEFPLCLVIGNEITGVEKEVIAECELGLEIPMFGIKQSLNVAVAYGIAVFELGRIWRSANHPAKEKDIR
ncbi:MAG: RNA methyltransferase [Bacteroidota bacterium]